MFEKLTIAWMFIDSAFFVQEQCSCVRTKKGSFLFFSTRATGVTVAKKHTCVVLSFNLMSILGSGKHLCCRCFCLLPVY